MKALFCTMTLCSYGFPVKEKGNRFLFVSFNCTLRWGWDCSRRTGLPKLDSEVRQTIHIYRAGVNKATCMTFTCLKQAYEKYKYLTVSSAKRRQDKTTT